MYHQPKPTDNRPNRPLHARQQCTIPLDDALIATARSVDTCLGD